jgi:hypothetical protein
MTSLTSAAEGASDLRPGSCGGNLYWFHTASSPKERASPAIKLDPLWFANRTLQSRLIACSSFFSVQFVKYISVPNHGALLGIGLSPFGTSNHLRDYAYKIIGDPYAAALKQDARTSNGIGRCAGPCHCIFWSGCCGCWLYHQIKWPAPAPRRPAKA